MEAISLVKALKEYFDIPGSKMIAEFKALTDKDKDDFVVDVCRGWHRGQAFVAKQGCLPA